MMLASRILSRSARTTTRRFSSQTAGNDARRVVVVHGDDELHSPALIEATKEVLRATGVPIEFDEEHNVTASQVPLIPSELDERMEEAGFVLRAPSAIPPRKHQVRDGDNKTFPYVDDYWKRRHNLLAQITVAKPLLSPLRSQHNKASDIDIAVVGTVQDGDYASDEHWSSRHSARSTRDIGRHSVMGATRIAFELAVQMEYDSLCVLHRADRHFFVDRMFRDSARAAANNPDFNATAFRAEIAATALQRFLQAPEHFDMILTDDVWHDVFMSSAAGMLGVTEASFGGALIGDNVKIFGAPHLTRATQNLNAFDVLHEEASLEQHVNPYGMFLSAHLLLNYLDEPDAASALNVGIWETVAEGLLPRELGGASTLREVTDAVVARTSAHAEELRQQRAYEEMRRQQHQMQEAQARL